MQVPLGIVTGRLSGGGGGILRRSNGGLGSRGAELNTTNPLGMKGEMAKEFGEMMKALWAGNAKFIIPRDFKWILSRFSTQFQGTDERRWEEGEDLVLSGWCLVSGSPACGIGRLPATRCARAAGLCAGHPA